jgi:hypothetical protein
MEEKIKKHITNIMQETGRCSRCHQAIGEAEWQYKAANNNLEVLCDSCLWQEYRMKELNNG